jgi:hypothetical protein
MEDMMIPTAAVVVSPPSPSSVVSSFPDEERVSDSRSSVPDSRNGNGPAASSGPTSSGPVSSGPINPGAEASDLSVEILAACRSLGKTEDYLVDWLGKKYQAGSIAGLTPLQQREVLSFLRQKIATQAA